MTAAEIETGDLKQALDNSEVRNDHLPLANGAIEKVAADRGIGSGILENSGTADSSRLQAGTGQKFTPLADRFLMADIDTRGVERQCVASEPGDGLKAPRPGLVDLQQKGSET